jgi:hypothetical protein
MRLIGALGRGSVLSRIMGEDDTIMAARELVLVDPATLHLQGARIDGADPVKLQRQIVRHGTSMMGMPPVDVKRGRDGELMIYDGVTRATRIAKYLPGVKVQAIVSGTLRGDVGKYPTVGEKI